MTRARCHSMLVALGVALAWALPPAADAASPLAEVIKASGESDRLDVQAVRAMYDDAVLGDGGIDRALRRLQVFADRGGRTARQRANVHLAMAHVHWRHGNREAALASIETALDAHQTTPGLLLKARLLDVAGDSQAAVPFYERALAATGRREEAEFIRIRLTMAQAQARNVEALIELASEREQLFRNRAAVALAILGHPDLANGIYRVVEGETGQPYREHVRLAQWALASSEHTSAQRHAWLAFDAAKLQIDARYALALLVESHRNEDSLRELIAVLEERGGAGNEILSELHVDLLIDTQQHDAAIAFYEAAAFGGPTVYVDARRRLVALYGATDRTDDMIREYRRLMAAEPDVVHWFSGLASHYVGLARRDDALAVWRAFEVANADRGQLAVVAGEHMVGMGFVEEAVQMVERQMAVTGENVDGLLFLFDVRRDRGRDDDALAILQRVEALLPPDDSAVRDLADAYERLSRPELALEILESLETRQDGLGYNERTRLAWLYSLADRKQDALEAWRALWVGVDNAARRRLAEDQLLLLAAELNTLADIVVELEEKLYAGRADRNEMDLLVRIYTEVGDTLSATEVVDEYARSSRVEAVERLRQLAGVYRLQNDYPGYDNVLRVLVRKDPDNEIEHVQNLVLNLLAHDLAEDSDERYGEIQRWLKRLSALDPEGVSGEFEAGVLSLGGFDDEAIESYRRALVENPDNSDNLLLMADRMKSVGRRDEAVTMLQYAAEHAVDDNAFVVAVDGIINMIGARSFGQRLTPELHGIFQWTQRVILERITAHADKFYLYQLLADIAQEIADTEGVFLALENALPQAGIRRPAILRELVTLATPKAGFAGFNTGRGDPERQLLHGRRLIGLGQALPPDVYINLGKVLLGRDDVAGAEKALDRIEDITGMIDVDRTKADLLHDAGYPEQALAHYARALSVDRDDLGLLARNAMLHEIRGNLDLAHGMYFRALGNLLRGEAMTRSGSRATNSRRTMVGFGGRPDVGVSRDYRTYFEFLVQGLLGTWPQSAEAARARTGEVEAMFDDALQAVVGADDLEDKTVADFPRLNQTTRFVRRIAESVGDGDLAERVDSALANRFPKDDAEPGAPPTPASSLLQRHLELAERAGNFADALQLARLVGDENTLAGLLRDQIAAGSYEDGLVNAWFVLDKSAFRRLVTPITSTLKDNASAFLRFLGRASQLLPAMEETLGRDFIAMADLIELVNKPDGPQGRVAFRGYGILPGVWRYVKAKGTLTDQIGFLASIARRDPQDQFRLFEVATIAGEVLSVELGREHRIALTDALSVYLSKQELSSPSALNGPVQLLLVDVHPGNAEVVYSLAAQLQERASTDIDLVAVLTDIHEGTPELGFAGLLELSKADLWRPGAGFSGGFDEKFDDERERILAAVERGDEMPLATAAFAYRMTFRRFGAVPRALLRRQADLAPHFAALDPDGQRYRLDGINALLALGEESEVEQALRDFYRTNPEDEFVRAALYLRLLREGKFGAALEVVADGGPDLRDQAAFDALLDKMSRGGASVGLFQRFYTGPLPRGPFNPYTTVVQRNIDRLREDARGHVDSKSAARGTLALPAETVAEQRTGPETAQSLRAVLRGARAPVGDGSRRVYRANTGGVFSLPLDAGMSGNLRFSRSIGPAAWISRLFATSEGEGVGPRLFDVLAEMPGVLGELERHIPSLPDVERRNQPGLYAILADALGAASLTGSELARLSTQLRNGSIGHHGFSLWMTLRHRDSAPLSTEDLDAFARRAAQLAEPTPSELLSMARVFAKAGAYDDAAEHYSLLAARLLRGGRRSQSFTSTVIVSGGAMMLTSTVPFGGAGGSSWSGPSLSEVLAETAEALPPAMALEFARTILAVARPPGDDEPSAAIFDAFVLKVLASAVSPGDVLAEAVRVSPSAPSVVAPLRPWQVPQALELMRVHAMTGSIDEALAVLRQFAVKPSGDDNAAGVLSDEDQVRQANAASGLAGTFGLGVARGEFGTSSTIGGLVEGRERVFPAHPDHVWDADGEWQRAAVAALQDWLDDADVDPAGVREMLFVAARQLYAAGEHDAARNIVAALGTRLDAEAEVDPAELRNLALLALRVGSPLPADLALAVAADGTLTAGQEAGLVRELAADDAVGALRAGRAADHGDKLELMRELYPLALAANDRAYADDLAARIDVAEAAHRELGSPDLQGDAGDT